MKVHCCATLVFISGAFSGCGFGLQSGQNQHGAAIPSLGSVGKVVRPVGIVNKDSRESVQILNPLLPPQAAETQFGFDKLSESGNRGIENLGATCYLASMVQLLSHSPAFLGSLGSTVFSDPNDIQTAFVDLVKIMWKTGNQSLNPRPLVKALQTFRSGSFGIKQMEDAHEVMWLILNHLRKAEGNPEDRSFVHELLSIPLTHSKTCKACNTKRDTLNSEEEINLSIPSPGFFSSAVSLLDCFKVFGKEEKLGSLWCEKCKANTSTLGKYFFVPKSDVLLILLKRYGLEHEKIHTRVRIPLLLNNAEINGNSQSEGAQYQLMGIVQHSGRNLQIGHYYTDYFDPSSKEWRRANDEYVTTISIRSPIISRTAYILLYERV